MKSRIFIILTIIIFLLISLNIFAQSKTPSPDLNNKDKIPQVPTLDWPFDRAGGFQNYAQELIFNKNRGEYYLDKAKAYYIAGYQGIQTYFGNTDLGYFKKITGIKWYEEDPTQNDAYLRNPYKVESLSISGPSVLQDFVDALWYFTKAVDILNNYVSWDTEVTTKPIYKDLLNNSYKSLIYCNVYAGNYSQALDALEEYKKNNASDENFTIEWEARIYGILVDIAKKYDWNLVGNKSYEYLKKKHKELLTKAIDFHYQGDSQTKEELKNRIYPEYMFKTKIAKDSMEEEQLNKTTGSTNKK